MTPVKDQLVVHRRLGPVRITAVGPDYIFHAQTRGPRRHGKTPISNAAKTYKVPS